MRIDGRFGEGFVERGQLPPIRSPQAFPFLQELKSPFGLRDTRLRGFGRQKQRYSEQMTGLGKYGLRVTAIAKCTTVIICNQPNTVVLPRCVYSKQIG